jgi:hypothetical protein
LCSDAPEDQTICLFAGLLGNPDVPLSHCCLLLIDKTRGKDKTLLLIDKGRAKDKTLLLIDKARAKDKKGWWRTGDIRVKKPKKTYECWEMGREE